MSIVNDLVSQHAAKDAAVQEEIAKLQAKATLSQASLVKCLSSAFTEHLDEDIDVSALSNILTQAQVLKLVVSIAETRALRDTELSDDLFLAAEQESYRGKSASLGEAIFASLTTDQQRLRFSLFCGGLSPIYRTVPSAKTFLESRIKVHFDYALEANYLRFDGYNPNLLEAAITLTTTKRCNVGLSDIASTLLDLMSLGYKGRQIKIFESSLSDRGVFMLRIDEHEGSEYGAQVIVTQYGQETVLFVGKGDSSKARLLSAMKHISNHIWYRDPDTEF